MKLQLMLFLVDILMLLACSYLWLKYAFVRAMRASVLEITEL